MPPIQILFGTDGSAAAAAGIDLLRRLPLPEGSAIHVVSAVDAQPTTTETGSWSRLAALTERAREEAAGFAREAGEQLVRPGVRVTTEVRSGKPADEVCRAAADAGADLIVIGPTGRAGLESIILGSVADSIVKRAQASVLVARPVRHELRRVIVATDGSANAERAVRKVGRLPLPAESCVVLTHVLETQRIMTHEELQAVEPARSILDTARASIAESGHSVETQVRSGDPREELLDQAREIGADLIVCGARGASLIEGLLWGSVADRLVKHAPCSVLVVK
ncbi:MAG: universal stress protein [Armatimonadota bacterium]